MIKLATVFSGIGAVEHALERMGLDYEIVFACDNGDVDILSKKIPNEILEIDKEINYLLLINNFIDNGIEEDFNTIKNDYQNFLNNLIEDKNLIKLSKTILLELQTADFINTNTKKIYDYWLSLYGSDDYSTSHKYFEALKSFVKIESDYQRFTQKDFYSYHLFDNSDFKENYSHLVNIFEFKKQIKILKDISDRLSMLHEKIQTEKILRELNTLQSFEEKNNFVNSLYEPVLNQNQVRKSYMANYDVDPSKFHWNVSFLDGSPYRNKVDLFVGGSPCQSFSLVGKQRGLEDTRGTLFYEYARLISEINPKVFIYENVKAVLSNDNGNTWEVMTNTFDELGYNCFFSVLNAKDYGVPQNRERVFVIGFKADLDITSFDFPLPVELSKTMKDFLIDNVPKKYYLPPKGIDFVTQEKNLEKRYTQIDGQIQLCQKKNQQFNWHGDFVTENSSNDNEELSYKLEKYFLSDKVKNYVLSSGTKDFYSKPAIDLDIARPLLTTMHKMHRAGVDNYVTSLNRLRKLTPRECLRLMGFCDTFNIVVSDTAMYQQAGNSIVVDVLIHVIERILEKTEDFNE